MGGFSSKDRSSPLSCRILSALSCAILFQVHLKVLRHNERSGRQIRGLHVGLNENQLIIKTPTHISRFNVPCMIDQPHLAYIYH